MSKSCILYIIRHGETEWNVKKLCQGQTDIPLNNKGEIQAGNLSKELSHIKFNAVYSSDLIRAKRTAEIVVLEKKLAVITTKALKERLFGRFEGKHLQELADIIGKSFSLPINKKQQLYEKTNYCLYYFRIIRFFICKCINKCLRFYKRRM